MQYFALLALFGAISLHGCGGGDEEEVIVPDEEVVTKVQSALNFVGISVDQAKELEPAFLTGIAETIDGVEESDIAILEYTGSSDARRLQEGVTVTFEVTVPAGVDVSAIETAITESSTDSTALFDAIMAAIEADPTMTAALGDSTFTLTVDAPTVVTGEEETTATTEAPATEAPATEAPATEKPTEKPTEAPTEAPVNGTNSSRRLDFAFTTNELIA